MTEGFLTEKTKKVVLVQEKEVGVYAKGEK